MNVERVLDSLNLDGIRNTLMEHYHSDGPGRNPFDPLAMLKVQLLKYLLQIPSDRRLAIRLRRDRRLAKACGFRRRRTPSHSLFTHFRHRLGEEVYQRIFNQITRLLIESGTMIGRVVAVEPTSRHTVEEQWTTSPGGATQTPASAGAGGASS